MLNAIAIDDEPLALDLIKKYCSRVNFIDLKMVFESSIDAYKYISTNPIDLIFLDIQMPGMLGTEFIKKTGLNTMVIFTTAYTNYAIEGYDLGIIDFLLKPFSFDRFFQAVERVTYLKKNIQTTDNSWDTPTLYLRSNYSYVKINLDNVLYIKGLEDYCKFYFKNESPVIFRITMKMLETKLPKGIFIRVHKSYIVRIDKADKKRASFLYISDTKIPIGRIYKKDVATTFEKLCPPNTRI